MRLEKTPQELLKVLATNQAGLYFGGPQAWVDRAGFDFFQAPDDTIFVRMGVQNSLRRAPTGVALIEGAQDWPSLAASDGLICLKAASKVSPSDS